MGVCAFLKFLGVFLVSTAGFCEIDRMYFLHHDGFHGKRGICWGFIVGNLLALFGHTEWFFSVLLLRNLRHSLKNGLA